MTIEEVYATLLGALRVSTIPFAFIGALGAMAWGRPRATTDLDLVVSCDEARFEALGASGSAGPSRAVRSVGSGDAEWVNGRVGAPEGLPG